MLYLNGFELGLVSIGTQSKTYFYTRAFNVQWL